MIIHTVLLTFGEDTPEGHVDAIVDELRALPRAIRQIRSYTVSRDMGLDDGNADISVVAHFDDQAGYRAYSQDPDHRRIIEQMILPHLSSRSALQHQA